MSGPLSNLLEEDAPVPALHPRTSVEQPEVVKPPEKKVTIILEENENIPPTGQFVQYGSGYELHSFIIRPGEEVTVPRAVLNVLDNAVQDIPQIDPTTRQVVGYRKSLRFPYRVIRDAA